MSATSFNPFLVSLLPLFFKLFPYKIVIYGGNCETNLRSYRLYRGDATDIIRAEDQEVLWMLLLDLDSVQLRGYFSWTFHELFCMLATSTAKFNKVRTKAGKCGECTPTTLTTSCRNMWKCGLVVPSNKPWTLPVILVWKMDGPYSNSIVHLISLMKLPSPTLGWRLHNLFVLTMWCICLFVWSQLGSVSCLSNVPQERGVV